MYYMIIMLKFMEREAEVKLVQNFYYKIYLVCIREAGKGFNLRLSTLYVYVVKRAV